MIVKIPVLAIETGDYNEDTRSYTNVETEYFLKTGLYDNFPNTMIKKYPTKIDVEIPNELLQEYLERSFDNE